MPCTAFWTTWVLAAARRGTGTLDATLTHYRTKIFGQCLTYSASVRGSLSLTPS